MGSLRDTAYLGLQNRNLSPPLSLSHLRSSSHVLLIITSLYVPQRLVGRLFSSLKLSSLCSAIKACRIFFSNMVLLIARKHNQPRSQSIDEEVRKMWYVYAMKFYAAAKIKPEIQVNG